MKKLYLLVAVMLLTGCSLLAPDFDNVEYNQFVRLETHAEYLQEECSAGADATFLVPHRLKQMKFHSDVLASYTAHLSGHEELARVAEILNSDIHEMINRGEMSKTYCELKAKQFKIKITRIIESIGKL